MGAVCCFYFTLWGLLFISFFSQDHPRRGQTPVRVRSPALCPANWFAVEQACYYLSRTPLSWYDAQTDCRTRGRTAHLASILSEREMKAISSYLTVHFEKIYQIWIGLHSTTKGKIRLWGWTDNAAVDYVPWAPNQPSNCGKKQDCVELYAKDYMVWNDEDCEVQQPYLCKMVLF